MIEKVVITNPYEDILELELTKPDITGLAVTSISGLGAGKANINISERGAIDGGTFNSARIPSRNITISLQFIGNNIEQIRQKTYKFFPLKKKIKMDIVTTHRHAYIYGIVESNDPDIFSQNEGTTISIQCPDPLFYASAIEGANETVFYGIEPSFEFAFSNESYSEKKIAMGEIKNRKENLIIYEGDADVGIMMIINSVGNVSNVSIYNVITREKMEISGQKINSLTGKGISQGDEIVICTVKGRKTVFLNRDGKNINILNCINRDADWFTLKKGDNIFAYTADEGSSNLRFKIINEVAYEGI